MDIIGLSFTVLKRFYKTPEKNLKLILSDFLDKEAGEMHQGITRTVYGVIRQERMLDYIIEQLARRKPMQIEMDILILLKIGVYLLIFSGSYPDHAVVNEAVHLTKGKAKGFVNAILRRCGRDKDNIHSMLEAIKEPHIRYSISPLLIENLKSISTDLTADLDYLNQAPLFHVRVNTNTYTNDFGYDEVQEVLTKEGVIARELKPFNSFEIKGSGGSGTILRNLSKEKKYFYFQNTGSQLISIIASQFSREAVLDCCAAPGTKSVTLSLLRPELRIYANDINVKRIRLLNDFCDGYGLKNIKPIVSDVKRLGFKKKFDFIILDAPCTSAGTLRKNPDLKLKINLSLVKKNAENQLDMIQSIIKNYSNVLLLYSVCSFIADETENVLDRMIKRREQASRLPKIEIMNLSAILDDYGFKYKKGTYGFYLLPDPILNNDLFYISLIKVKDSDLSL
jgi:16S rRNA (cytosine967-C5)-methyltransferase